MSSHSFLKIWSEAQPLLPFQQKGGDAHYDHVIYHLVAAFSLLFLLDHCLHVIKSKSPWEKSLKILSKNLKDQ